MAEPMEAVEEEIMRLSASELVARTRQLENELRDRKSEATRLQHEVAAAREQAKENAEKIKMNKQLPYLVSTAVEVLDEFEAPEDADEATMAGLAAATAETAATTRSSRTSAVSSAPSPAPTTTVVVAAASPQPESKAAKKKGKETAAPGAEKKGKCVVIKTSTRQTVYLPVVGLVDARLLRPGDLVGVNKDSYLILERLPPEYDARVKAMEVDERPQEEYSDIGGLDKQIQELVEAVVLPMTHKDRFEQIGIQPPKGVLLYGPPGTGKTLMARACAAQTKATFLKLAGPQLVQMFIGDGAKLVRDAFALAKEKGNAIIFIDELDAVGAKRHDSEMGGDREVQRTMLELLNQMDGFSSTATIKVIAATNRVDILDPALLRSGRLDRKIELPLPTEEARSRILQIHSRKMNVGAGVNFEELARMTPDFNGAQLKAVCVEAGMLALRRDATELSHEDYVEGIAEVQAKKKKSLEYFA